MKEEDKKLIYEAIAKHGDSFWHVNESLVAELDVMLLKAGYELAVKKVGAK